MTLQEKETADSTLTGLDGLLETSEALTKELGDAEDWTSVPPKPLFWFRFDTETQIGKKSQKC